MRAVKAVQVICCFLLLTVGSEAQVTNVAPQVRAKALADGSVTTLEVAPHFVTAIRVPEPVNSVAVGDPALFQVEHSEREPDLVLVKALTERSAETNLLISGARGRQFSLLLVSRGTATPSARVDFILQYKPARSFLVEPEIVPFPLVGQTTPIVSPEAQRAGGPMSGEGSGLPLMPASISDLNWNEHGSQPNRVARRSPPPSLDDLLLRQESAALPVLHGEHVDRETVKGDRLRVGASEVIDRGQHVFVLFSVVNTSKRPILLMTPQVQLGGKSRAGKILKHDRWTTAEQLPVADFRLSRRRLGKGERADGVVVFERPPYKQSNEQLFLQMADAGAVDRPALAPIGFGISSGRQEEDHAKTGTGR